MTRRELLEELCRQSGLAPEDFAVEEDHQRLHFTVVVTVRRGPLFAQLLESRMREKLCVGVTIQVVGTGEVK